MSSLSRRRAWGPSTPRPPRGGPPSPGTRGCSRPGIAVPGHLDGVPPEGRGPAAKRHRTALHRGIGREAHGQERPVPASQREVVAGGRAGAVVEQGLAAHRPVGEAGEGPVHRPVGAYVQRRVERVVGAARVKGSAEAPARRSPPGRCPAASRRRSRPWSPAPAAPSARSGSVERRDIEHGLHAGLAGARRREDSRKQEKRPDERAGYEGPTHLLRV